MNNIIIGFVIFGCVCALIAVIVLEIFIKKEGGVVPPKMKEWKIPEHPNCRCTMVATVRGLILDYLGELRDNYKSAFEISKAIKRKYGTVSGVLCKMRKEKNSPVRYCTRIYKFKKSQRESIVYKIKIYSRQAIIKMNNDLNIWN